MDINNINNILKDKPRVTLGLLEYLKSAFPIEKSLKVKDEEGLFKLQGNYEVISHLERLYDQQIESGNIF